MKILACLAHRRAQWLILIALVSAIAIHHVSGTHPLQWPNWTGIGQDISTSISTEKTAQDKVTKITTTEHIQSSKTLWDWLNALVIPLSLAGLGFWVQEMQRKRSEIQEVRERDIANNHLNEEVLQTYLDRLSDLLIDKELYRSKPGEPKREAAMDVIRARTLSILQQLDSERKGSVIRFLFDTDLITKFLLNLSGANLCAAHLRGANLRGARLTNTNLRGADLRGANLEEVDLAEANLTKANLGADNELGLFGTNLQLQPYTNLRGASLIFTNFQDADLSDADLKGANLLGANLQGVNLRNTNLSEVQNLTAEQIYGAKNWQLAHYDTEFCNTLGLASALRQPKSFADFVRAGLQVSEQRLAKKRSRRRIW